MTNKRETCRMPVSVMWKTRKPTSFNEPSLKELAMDYVFEQLHDANFYPDDIEKFRDSLDVSALIKDYPLLAKIINRDSNATKKETARRHAKLRNAVLNAIFLALGRKMTSPTLCMFLIFEIQSDMLALSHEKKEKAHSALSESVLYLTFLLSCNFRSPLRNFEKVSAKLMEEMQDILKPKDPNALDFFANHPAFGSSDATAKAEKDTFSVVKNAPTTEWTSNELKPWKPLLEPLDLVPPGNIDALRQALLYDFPWAEEAITKITLDISVSQKLGKPFFKMRPTLLVGPPGCGKTALAQRIAELSGVPSRHLNLAGMSDNRTFAGTSRGWNTANPSFLAHVFRDTKTANPLIILDEIDKAGGGAQNGDVKASLLQVLDPVTAGAWLDECLSVYLDVSAVSFIATANTTFGLSGPLLQRLRVVEVSSPGVRFCRQAASSLVRAKLREHDLPADFQDVIPEEIMETIAIQIGRDSSLRGLSAKLDGMIAALLTSPRGKTDFH